MTSAPRSRPARQSPLATAAPILARVLYWTDGHPFLTVRLAKDLREAGASSPDAADRYVADSYTSLQRLGQDTHIQSILRFVAERLTDSVAPRSASTSAS